MNGSFSMVNVGLLVIGIILIVSGVKKQSPKDIFKNSVANSKSGKTSLDASDKAKATPTINRKLATDPRSI